MKRNRIVTVLVAAISILCCHSPGFMSSTAAQMPGDPGGQLTDITLSVEEPICVGVDVDLTATDNGTPPTAYNWFVRCDTMEPWRQFEEYEQTAYWAASHVGEFLWKCEGPYTGYTSTVTRL